MNRMRTAAEGDPTSMRAMAARTFDLPVGLGGRKKGRRIRQAVWFCIGIFVSGCAPTADPSDSVQFIIRNANVVDVASGSVLSGHSVFIRDGWITGVAPTDEGEEGAGDATIMDAAGRYLIPGLWDMHVHFRGGEELIPENKALLPLYIANGVTTVRDGGGDITESVLEWREKIEQGDLVGPRILTPGPKLDGPTGGWDGSIRLAEPGDVRPAIDSLQALGVDYIKIYDGTTSRDVYLAIVEEARRRDMIVTGHMPMSVRFREALDRGLDGTEHLYYAFKGGAANEDSVTEAVISRRETPEPLGFRETLNLLRARYDEATARSTFDRMAETGTAVVPTLHIGAVLAHVDTADHSSDTELHYIHPNIEATYARRVEGARRSTPQARADRLDLQRLFISMVPEMNRAGVTILAGSDAGPFNSFVYPGFSLHSELQELVAAGLTPAEALRAATMTPAHFMRMGKEFGQVGEGFRADLVLLEANPLEDIANTRSVTAVILGGETIFERTDLEGLLASARR